MTREPRPRPRHQGILRRLARDTRGNALILMAAMIVPLLAFSGAAVDMARLYVVKVRLQHACDAGALAGRKAMTNFKKDGTALDSAANKQAETFFDNNFVGGWMQTKGQTRTFTKQSSSADIDYANLVVGQASATVPMTIMQIVFTLPDRSIAVTCQAQSDMADADTVFVLDMSNSMACSPTVGCGDNPQAITYADGTTGFYSQEVGSDSKLEQVRQGVLAYDQAIRANADPTTHFRYGFAPYGANVNIGRLLYGVNNNYIETGNWSYQTRSTSISDDYPYDNSSTTVTSVYPVPQAACKPNARFPTGTTMANGYVKGMTYSKGTSPTTANYYASVVFPANVQWSSDNNGTCSRLGTNNYITVKRITWTYGQKSWALADYVKSGIYQDGKSGAFLGPQVLNPSRVDGSLSQRWHGCVEEADTASEQTPSAGAPFYDLDPSFIPMASPSTNRWRPAWPDVEWQRDPTVSSVKDEKVAEETGYANDNPGKANYAPQNFNYRGNGTSNYLGRTFYSACGVEAQRLKVMSTDDLTKYLSKDNGFLPSGRTYHDVGMKWGARLLWPSDKGGPFQDSKAWPGRNDPKRFLVFLTDGAIFTDNDVYDEYGVERFDKRVTEDGTAQLTNRHRNRFLTECDAAKRAGITIQIVLFATGSNDAMNQCASKGYPPKVVKTGAELVAYFQALGTGVAKLRISQ